MPQHTATPLQQIAQFAHELALAAGETVRAQSVLGLQHQYKSQQELVTQADLLVDQQITAAIARRFPTHRILSEESLPDLHLAREIDTPLWIIDPIDGTVNYAYGHRQVAVSIAYAEGGQVQLGIVHCPFLDETFSAQKGQGALLNGQRIRHSQATVLRQALVATGFPYTKDKLAPLIRRLDRVLHHCRDIRRIGSAAIDICWVACGRLDAYYETVSPWDFAAARLIAQEAGARCGHFSPVPADYPVDLWGQDILISAPALYEALHALLIERAS